MNTTKVTKADRLTNRHTAFSSFAEFCEAMKAGYVPTIYGADCKGKARLVAVVRKAGFKVYDGVKVA